MKKAIVLSAILTIFLSGCCFATKNNESELYERFEVVEQEGMCRIIVDNETGVLYFYDRSAHQSGLTVLLNADGTPMTLEE